MPIENYESTMGKSNKIEFKRYAKYEVLKLDDIVEYLNERQKKALTSIINTIQNHRKAIGKVPCHSYVVVNEGEPYAEQVWKLIQEQ